MEVLFAKAFLSTSGRTRGFIKLKHQQKAPPEQIQAAQEALERFRKEAVRNKERVKIGTMTEQAYESWLLEQEKNILEIIK